MTEVRVSCAGLVTANGKLRAGGDSRGGPPPTATDLDDDKEGIRPLVSIRDSSGSDLDSGPNVRTRAGLSGGMENTEEQDKVVIDCREMESLVTEVWPSRHPLSIRRR